MKILLLDDDDFLLDMYATKFSTGGHEVTTVKSVEDALRQLRGGGTFDVILLDMVLPNATGVDFLNSVKAEKLAGSAKLIVLSNQSDDEEIAAAKAAGAHGYIIKAHLIPSEVLSKVEEVIKTTSTVGTSH